MRREINKRRSGKKQRGPFGRYFEAWGRMEASVKVGRDELGQLIRYLIA